MPQTTRNLNSLCPSRRKFHLFSEITDQSKRLGASRQVLLLGWLFMFTLQPPETCSRGSEAGGRGCHLSPGPTAFYGGRSLRQQALRGVTKITLRGSSEVTPGPTQGQTAALSSGVAGRAQAFCTQPTVPSF